MTATTRRRIATRARRTGFWPARRVRADAQLGREPPPAARQFRIKPLVSAVVTADVQSAKLEWERAYRALEETAQDPVREESLTQQLEVITGELRRRLGGKFTLRELASEYVRADVWTRDALERAEIRGWPPTLSLVEGAAFHLYARGAVDYSP